MKYYKLNFSLSSENQPNLTVEIYSPDELEISIHWSNHGGNCNITPTSKTKRPYGKTTIFVELLKKIDIFGILLYLLLFSYLYESKSRLADFPVSRFDTCQK